MSLFIYLMLLLANIWHFSYSYENNLILKSVAIVHRHGDRTPLSTFPTDLYANASFWPDGWGELTIAGKIRMFSLGEYLRLRYGNFWPTNIREVEVRSSDADRCLESAGLVLSGAFPPTGRWVWSDKLNWVPFPIHTEPRPVDSMLNPGSFCPNAEKEENRIRASSFYKSYEAEFLDLFDLLERNTKMNVTDLITAQRIFDTLKIQRENNYTLPSWANSNVMSRLSRVCDLTFYLDYSTHLIQRLRAGELLKDIKNRFISLMRKPPFIKNEDGLNPISDIRKKIFFYSTHDSQLAILLNALKVFDKLSPPYGSSVFFELYHETNSNRYKLALLYLNDTYSKNPHYLELPNCDAKLCDIDQFFKQIADYIPDNWRNECGLDKAQCEEDLFTISMNLLNFIVISLVITTILIYLAIKKKGKDAYVYQMLPVL